MNKHIEKTLLGKPLARNRSLSCMKPLLFAASAILVAGFSLACELNVREAGFMDKHMEGPYIPDQYGLFMIVSNDTPAVQERMAQLRKLKASELADCNLSVGVVVAEHASQSERAQMKQDSITLDKLPATILFKQGATDRTKVLAAPRMLTDEEIVALAVSPAKIQLQQLLADTTNHHVVVMIAGSDTPANRMAEKAISAGIKACAAKLEKQQIRFLNVDGTDKAEKWFLKEIVSDAKGVEPVCVVVFGKGRIVVPILEGEEITADAIIRAFSFLQHNASDCVPGAVYLPGSTMDMIMPWNEKLDARMRETIVVPEPTEELSVPVMKREPMQTEKAPAP
jgi:hypothetical protein